VPVCSRPNFLFCVFDSLSSSVCSVLNDQAFDLPALGRLQDESAVISAAYSPCPESSPARASLFTGLDPSVHGVWTNGVDLPKHVLKSPSFSHGPVISIGWASAVVRSGKLDNGT